MTDFAAAVAVAKNPSLAEHPICGRHGGVGKNSSAYPITQSMGGRSTDRYATSSCKTENPLPAGTPLGQAKHAKADAAITTIAQAYSPSIQCDRGGHIYLDMQGTTRLFGPVVDSAVHIRGEIKEKLNLDASVAVASNKLVAKVGTRTTRPAGLIQVREGDEASFLAWQDVSLLSGVGVATARLLSVAGITTIGQIAALKDDQVLAFLGKRGLALRDAARGLDSSPLQTAARETACAEENQVCCTNPGDGCPPCRCGRCRRGLQPWP